MSTLSASTHKSRSEQNKASHPFDLSKVRYSSRWLGLGAGLGIAAALATYRGGLPVALALGALGAAGATYATLVEPRRPQLDRVTLRLPKLPAALDGMRIGLLGDMHLGHPFTTINTRWAVEQMQREQPDLIALTGDFVSFDHAIIELPDLLRPLHAPLGVYAVPGNHDYWEGLDDIRALLEPLGVQFLMNRGLHLEWKGERFFLAGIDDVWDGHPDVSLALTARKPDDFTVLLAHAPDMADEAAEHQIDLQLSGHTHGGHIYLPGLGSFCLPFYGLRYAIGQVLVGDLQVYVTRGLGGMPLRFGCPPEATLITLRQG